MYRNYKLSSRTARRHSFLTTAQSYTFAFMFQKLSILRFSKQRPSPGDTAQTLIQLYKVGVLTTTCKPLAQQLVQDRCAHNDVEAFGTAICA